MPVSDPMLDPGYADLISELRDARTPTPSSLEARVDELLLRRRPAHHVPRRLPRPRLRVVLAVAGGCTLLVAGIVAASRTPGSSTQNAATPAFATSVAAAAATDAAAPASSTAAARPRRPPTLRC